MKKQGGYLSGGYEVNVRDLQKFSWVTDNIKALGQVRGMPCLQYRHRHCMENSNK